MLLVFSLFFVLVVGAPSSFNSRPYAELARHAASTVASANSSLVVDLGYSIYRGTHNASSHIDMWQGIRYAQDTSGELRWQAPRAPLANRSAIIEADGFPAQCPQSPDASSGYTAVDNSGSSEDCLFLEVYSPTNVTSEAGLPVVVWIHGGGYGEGSGAYDMTAMMTTNANRFMAVSIQYRLGAFGFLSSDEVYRRGVVNAGLLDQQLALQWVQQYIRRFGGDPARVTIFGESAGAGSVMLHDLAYGGNLGAQLFRNSITASPYLAFQYGYSDWQPSQAYYAFAAAAGCDAAGDAYLRNGSRPIFDCLVSRDSAVLMAASASVSQSGTAGTWAFLPVTDGRLIQQRPSRQLGEGRVNGINHLAGNNALEGASWVTERIATIDDLVAYLRLIFPNFSNNDIAKVLLYYPMSNASTDYSDPLWATEGDSGPTNINQSTAATGQQERAIAIYGETTFICPSYWLAEAYSDNGYGGQGWKYQFSIPNAYHGADGSLYFSYPYATNGYYSGNAVIAFMTMLGNFIVNDDPSIPSGVANGVTAENSTFNPVSEWPPYSVYDPHLMDFNTTCPHTDEIGGLPYCTGPGEKMELRLANAYTWEGGRGVRCDFWKSMGELVPE
ncbi:carboxylesterase [Xylariaceae sp. FL0804]|nr:carboxylesterase [Xylariaceae sp. FL0804]